MDRDEAAYQATLALARCLDDDEEGSDAEPFRRVDFDDDDDNAHCAELQEMEEDPLADDGGYDLVGGHAQDPLNFIMDDEDGAAVTPQRHSGESHYLAVGFRLHMSSTIPLTLYI